MARIHNRHLAVTIKLMVLDKPEPPHLVKAAAMADLVTNQHLETETMMEEMALANQMVETAEISPDIKIDSGVGREKSKN